MLRKAKKILLAAAIGGAVLGASPANAWYAITYLYPNGTVAGGQIFCDDGYLAYQEGIQTSNYSIDYHIGAPPC